MKAICFYFQVHQPFRLKKDFDFFAIGSCKGPDGYEDSKTNRDIIVKVANKCYLPANRLILKLIKRHKERFKVSYSISGTALEQFSLYAPEVIDSFRELIASGNVELIHESYYHSLAFLKSPEEFIEQINLHNKLLENVFGPAAARGTTFRNTELIYSNKIAQIVKHLGYKTILTEGSDSVLGLRSPNFVYNAKGNKNIRLLLKNYKLSDDIAFRFSDRKWKDYPLAPEKYARWIRQVATHDDVINLFMDYETFGEHQWEDSGIFKFLEEFPQEILEGHLSRGKYLFMTPSEVASTFPVKGELDVENYISWADKERDLSAWMGNSMQNCAFDFAFSLESMVKASGNLDVIHTWRKLQSSDHFYYASIKNSSDGDIHNYFSPYASPHDAFITYTNVLNDLKLQLDRNLFAKRR
ncbi:MAG: alpha-amylase [Bdellovibrionales bacterium RIFOXYD12_FULL_39_22]|nr:MAG: alpha-amylase [Bdellovibrionales bacterium RIFOXYB1_FULL_39_21]OFZ43750.1 MAG: alpha-amylase [Bdellovibrionales bacterium RIFOXYC12_FULL_39_17]OFZ48079.1 MAG: alpha-amylase [Bdellovibrionales bacterium RIFOXYC1_FULL_39_130]OFZ77258.1 MAG: alpha-amylase [Bdellovibrionales bacterium RIFOXYD1_FULL_39_84]OFZ95682.1 MAG: alpha-amylase [Bdellovibrionales bacterium RIFOXYD12_FULL_39_22]HLE11450.1 glycoside hydrolase family 57 protein [Bacteriovoracaceae bacterium]